MPFPLPLNSDFRRQLILDWLLDVEDRLPADTEGAEISWRNANSIYLSLGAGEGDETLEDKLAQTRVKLDQTETRKP